MPSSEFESGSTYRAIFNNVSGLANGNFVRVAGVEVGKVTRISITPTTPQPWSSPPTTRWS
jgi:phospholipid/cholesterol/gamma-HCH transport system substrate-binding protein